MSQGFRVTKGLRLLAEGDCRPNENQRENRREAHLAGNQAVFALPGPTGASDKRAVPDGAAAARGKRGTEKANMSDLANTRRNPDIVDNATDWIAKLDRGLTGDEERRFKAWLFESDGNYAVFMELAKLWDRMDILESLAVTREDSERRPGGGWRKALPIAASIAAIALASAWIA